MGNDQLESALMTHEEVYPVKKGDWVRNESGRVATVRDVYWLSGELLVDLYLYNDNGDRTGRESPRLGGPRTFEPACAWKDWHRITRPEFPYCIVLGEPDENGFRRATKSFGERRLPDRKLVRRKLPKPVISSGTPSNASLEDEAAKLRFAATEFRDMYRKTKTPELLQRAVELESEAERILR